MADRDIFDILTYDVAEDNSSDTPALLNIATKTTSRTNSPDDDPTGYTPLLSLTSTVERPPGVYEFGLSLNWNLNAAQKEAMIAFKRSGAAAWNIGLREPKDANDRNFSVYTFPHTITVSEILTLDIQITMFDGSITSELIDVFFVNAWIKRVG